MTARQLVKEYALCLRAVEYGDTSQVVCLLTSGNGKVSAIAKGSRRPKSAFDGALEIFSYGIALLYLPQETDRLAVLTEFHQQPRFRLLRNRLETLQAGLLAAEITEHYCIPLASCQTLFEQCCQRLEQIQTAADTSQIAAACCAYLLDILQFGGILPQFGTCVNCGQPLDKDSPEHYFSSTANGRLCFGCESSWTDKMITSPACLMWLAHGAPTPMDLKTALEGLELLIRHFSALLHRPIKTAPMLLQLLKRS